MERRWWGLAGVAIAVFAVGIDGTVLAIALPTLAGALHASATDLVWFSSAYLLTWAAAMLPLGALGDRYGRRRVMLASLTAFGLASAWAASSSSAAEFVAARAVGGIAGAGIVVMAMSAVTVMFDEHERPRAVGIWAAVNFLALPVGPLVGGWLLSRYSWSAVFWVNVPVVVVALVATLLLVPESRGEGRGRIDWLGATAFSAGLVGLVYGFAEAGAHGWGSLLVLGSLAAGAVSLVGFAAWQRHLVRGGGDPLVDVRLFRSRAFVGGTTLAFVASLTMVGLVFLLPQYFQAVLGVDTVGAGVRLLPLIGGLVLGAVSADALARRFGPRLVLTTGFVVLAGGFALGAATRPGSGVALLVTWTLLAGAGLGATLSTGTAGALSDVPTEQAGVASALLQALQDAGGPFGAAVLGTVSLAAYAGALELTGLDTQAAEIVRQGVFDGIGVARELGSPALLDDVRTAFVQGVDAALLVCGGVALAGAVIALTLVPRRRPVREAPEAGPDRTAAVAASVGARDVPHATGAPGDPAVARGAVDD